MLLQGLIAQWVLMGHLYLSLILITTLNGRVKKAVSARPSSHADKLGRIDHKVSGRTAEVLRRPIHSAIRKAKKENDAYYQQGQLGSGVLFPSGDNQIY